MMHSPAEATFDPDEAVEAVPFRPGLIDTEVPPDPAVAVPLIPPAPIEVEEPDEPVEPLAVLPPFSVRQGCWLFTTIVVPPLLPLMIETLAPPPEVELVESAEAIVAEPATSNRLDRTISARIVDFP